MSDLFLRIIKHLLPNAKAWRLVTDKTLRQFFEGLSGVGADVREFIDLVWADIDPQQTRQLELWEEQFGLSNTPLTEQQRRDRVEAAWAEVGGQDPRYIQDTLQAAGFDVYVHEWWEPATNPPVARNPLLVIGTPGSVVYVVGCNETLAFCGEVEAEAGNTANPLGYLLINKTPDRQNEPVPALAAEWPYMFYIGGQTYGTQATVDAARRDEFEALCLKICPTQLWLGVMVTFA